MLAREIIAINKGAPINYLDIGSAGGMHPAWRQLIESGFCKAILVDMADEYARNSQAFADNATHIKTALSDHTGSAKVFITRHPACSSCLPPDFVFLQKYPVSAWFEVVREASILAERYDEVAGRRALPQPQIAKIDVQGYEAHVLRGMGAILDETLCVEFECQLQGFYLGQSTFIELYGFMRAKGFVLRDMKPQGPFEGEAVEFNSYWSRAPRNPAEAKIIELWQAVNDVWPGCYLHHIDDEQRHSYQFNE